MKYFLWAVTALLATRLSAQKLLINPSDSIIATATIKPGFVTEVSAYIVNNSSAPIDLKWVFESYGGSVGTYVYTMCDAYNCYAAGPQVRTIDLAPGDSTFMKFGIETNCIGGNAYGIFRVWVDGDSAATVRRLVYKVVLDASDCLSLGLGELNSPKLSVFPNPVLDVLHLNSEFKGEPKHLSISSVSGKVVYSESFIGLDGTVNFISFPSGIYFLNVHDHSGLLHRYRIIKQ